MELFNIHLACVIRSVLCHKNNSLNFLEFLPRWKHVSGSTTTKSNALLAFHAISGEAVLRRRETGFSLKIDIDIDTHMCTLSDRASKLQIKPENDVKPKEAFFSSSFVCRTHTHTHPSSSSALLPSAPVSQCSPVVFLLLSIHPSLSGKS